MNDPRFPDNVERPAGRRRAEHAPALRHAAQSRRPVEATTEIEALRAENARLGAKLRDLEAALERYARVYEGSPFAYFCLDSIGRVLHVNLSGAALLGEGRSRITGKSFSRYFAGESRNRFLMHLHACKTGAAAGELQLELETAHGVSEVDLVTEAQNGDAGRYHTIVVPLSARLRPGRAETNEELASAVRDLRIQRHQLETQNERLGAAQRLLEESRDRYAFLYDFSPLGYLTLDEGGRIRALNLTAAAMLGPDRARITGKSLAAYMDAADAEHFARHLQECRAGIPQVRTELKVRVPGGLRDIELISARPADAADEPLYHTAMTDITERKHAVEALRESEERFRQIAENINDVFFLANPRGDRILYLNSAVERLWGFSAETLYRDPQSWLQMVHEADRKRLRRALQRRKPTVPCDVEFRIRRPAGAVRWIHVRGFPICDAEGRVYRFAGIAADVTAHRAAAESLQRSHERMRKLALHLESVREEERKRIAREIHDDLGALLLAIKMDLEAVRKALSAGKPQTAAVMDDTVARVDMAIEAVRAIATDLRPSILDHLGVAAAVEWQAQNVERRTGIKCDIEIAGGKDELNVDPDRATAIFRIVQEALSNVVRHSEATHVKIVLHERAGNVDLRITDNGKGIEAEGASDLRKWGLIGIAERVGGFKGKFRVLPAQPRGTTLAVSIPAGARAARAGGRNG